MRKTISAFLLLALVASAASAQMKRERSPDAVLAEDPFWATSVILLPSVTQLPASNLNFTIQHTFGLLSDGLDGLFGLDASANIRFGLDYGITDRISIGVGRSRFDKVVDVRSKARLGTWSLGGRSVHVAAAATMGMDTRETGATNQDRFSSFVSLLMASSITDRITIQLSPSWSHFNAPAENIVFGGGIQRDEGDIVVLGVAGKVELTPQVAVLFEFLPVLGARSDGTNDAMSLGVDLETGGHVFQLYVTSTQWIAPQYAVTKSTQRFLDGDFGFGFTVHRVF